MGAVLMELPDTYGERLRLFRDEAKLSQEELAVLSGKATLSIGRWETGIRSPKLEDMQALADALKRPLTDFVDGIKPHVISKRK